jgi:hypothetical protein
MKLMAVIGLFLCSINLYAQQVTISPAEIITEMKPGESRNFEVAIQNDANVELKNMNFHIREYINKPNMNMIDTIRVVGKEKPSHDMSIVPFVKADTGAISPISAKSQRKFTINVSIPKDYKKTIGYFVYSIEPNKASLMKQSQLATGSLMQFFGRGIVNVKQPHETKKMDIAKMQLTKKGVADLEIKNSGNQALELEGDIVILDSSNKQLGKFDLTTEYNTKKQLALPLGVAYKFNTAFPPQLIKKGNQLLITVRDYKRDFSQSFLKTVKAP